MSQNNEQVMRLALEALRPFYQDALRIHPDWADERRRASLTQEKPLLVSDFRKAVSAFMAIETALAAQATLKLCAYCSQPMQTNRKCPAHETEGNCVATLAAQAGQSEPFAWCISSTNSADWCFSATEEGVEINALLLDADCIKSEPFPLYTGPSPVRQPLSDDELGLICEQALFGRISYQQLARSIEAAHGITAQKAAHD